MDKHGLIVILLAAISCTGFSVDLHDRSFKSETFLQIPCEDIGRCTDFVFDNDGNIYTIHTKDKQLTGSVYKITPPYEAMDPLCTDLIDPLGMIWAGGTEYGDCLLIADRKKKNNGVRGEVTKVTPDGEKSKFAWGLSQPNTLQIDTTGNYGYLLYVANSDHDCIEKVDPKGGSAVGFSPHAFKSSGSMLAIAFDTTGNYGGKMFVASKYVKPEHSGLFTMDTEGKHTRYTDAIGTATYIAFDTTPHQSFNGKMYVAERNSSTGKFRILQVENENTLNEFVSCNFIKGNFSPKIRFSNKDTMYIMEYDATEKIAIITRITPAW